MKWLSNKGMRNQFLLSWIYLCFGARILEQMNFTKVIGNSYHLPVMGSHQRVDVCPIGAFWPDTFDMEGRGVEKVSQSWSWGCLTVYIDSVVAMFKFLVATISFTFSSQHCSSKTMAFYKKSDIGVKPNYWLLLRLSYCQYFTLTLLSNVRFSKCTLSTFSTDTSPKKL